MKDGFPREDLKQYAAAVRGEFEKVLSDLVEIPTISVEPDRKGDVHRGAEYAVRLIESSGGKAQRIETKGHPIVYGRFDRGANLPTVTVYNHLDVQPAGRETDWDNAPFRVHPQGDRYFGRGTTDDKGPALTALFGARYAREHDVAVNIHFLWEFEEEIGVAAFRARPSARRRRTLRDRLGHRRRTRSGSPARNPAAPAGLRGLQGFRFDAPDRHDRPAFRHHRRRGAQPGRRDLPARSPSASTARPGA